MITLQHLGLAYRKAKVDLYYSSHASIDAIADYEENLLENLSSLLAKINGESEDWVKGADFLGTYTVAAKSVDIDAWKAHQKEHGNGLIFSSAADEWAYACAELAKGEKSKQLTAEFRINSWLRDVLRVKGGVTDYCVIGEIDVKALRRFQSSHRSATKPFKPVPDGFEIDFGRKVLPAENKK
jgi:hypothetical protein